MEEKEFKYLLNFLEGITEELYEELLQLYYDMTESKSHKMLSNNIKSFFRNNLKNNPVTTVTLLSFFQHEPNIHNINELYLECISNVLGDVTKMLRLISLISMLKFEDEYIHKILESILKKLSNDVVEDSKKQLILSLITQRRPELISVCTNVVAPFEESSNFKLTPQYMLKLCYEDQLHWLLAAVKNYSQQILDMKNVSFKMNNFTVEILILVLIDLMNNQEKYDLLSLVQKLTNIFSMLSSMNFSDKQLQFYITEVKRELTIVKFCLDNKCELLPMSIFHQILSKSALALVSEICDLANIDRYKLSIMLNANNDSLQELALLSSSQAKSITSNWDSVTYNSYCALTTTIDIITNSDSNHDVTVQLDEVKRLVMSLQPLQFCIETIENILSCLFLRYEHFSYDDNGLDNTFSAHSDCSYFYSKKQMKVINCIKKGVGFICNLWTAQMILNILKHCLDSVESKYTEGNEIDMKKLINISKIINNALWKLDLVTTLSPYTSQVQTKLCLNYVDVADSSEDDENDVKVTKKKTRVRRRPTNPKSDNDQVMISSTMSMTDEGHSLPTTSNVQFISIMLAKPNSLVALALHHNDFSKANQIIEMFDLADAEIAAEVKFTEQQRQLVARIKNILHHKDDSHYPNRELSTLSVISTEVMSLVETFLSSNRAPNCLDTMELAARHPHLQLYNYNNSSFIAAVDLLLSCSLNKEITYALINVVERKLAEVRTSTDINAVKKSNYIRYVEDIVSVMFEIYGNTEKCFEFASNICALAVDCRIPLNHKEFCKYNLLSKDLRKCCRELHDVVNPDENADQNLTQKYHQTYMNVVAASDKDICNMSECSGSKKNRVPYLRMCYIYCKTVFQLDHDEMTASVDSNIEQAYFSIFSRRLHTIIKNVIDQGVPVVSLEPVCKKLNVNLIHKVILNFCPPIILNNCHKEASEFNFNNLLQVVYEFKNTEENLFLEPTADFSPLPVTEDKECLSYIFLQNWVLAYLVKKVLTFSEESNLQNSIDYRTKLMNSYMDLKRFDYTKILFNNNRYLAALHSNLDLDSVFQFLPKLISSGKILKCLYIIDAMSERQLLKSANLMNLRDLVLFKLATHPRIEANWKYCLHLKCPELKINLILNNLNSWLVEGAMEVLDYLRYLLEQNTLDEGLYDKCTNWMVRIPLYEQISTIMGATHWFDVFEKSIESPEEIVEDLMESQQYKLCLEWADAHDVTENMKTLIIMSLLRQLFEYTNQATPDLVKELLSRLPQSQATELIQEEMPKIRNVEILQSCVDFVMESSMNWKSFENIKIGLQIMLEIDTNLRPLFWDLVEKPLLMIEQFLMNAKLDILADIIDKIACKLKKDPAGDNLYYNIKSLESLVISRNAVDALLRFYAEKALDMSNPRNTYTPPPKPSDESLMQSIDSINIMASSKPFVMPEEVPSKERWVEDYSTDRCMLCLTSIFSMIIRRHHCRRCGRLVCHGCSRHKMQVPTYPSGVKFRVCDDCYKQTEEKKSHVSNDNALLSSASDSAGSAVTCMDWCLSSNAKRNEAVRNEFSFEFTPNVTLCLTIMKMHSINLDYPRFLLDRSDEVGREVGGGGDARLLVRARRSLLLAAAELYSRPPQNTFVDYNEAHIAETGAAHVARCLAHSDAMATLVRHASQHLMPQQGAHPSHIVRSLLEAEKWELALEIATKSGLSRNSVLAAWGKACLKAGCFKQAREKFAHCFKNTFQAVYDGVEECEFGREASESSPYVNRRIQSLRTSERTSSNSSLHSDGRPRSNPPLLNEIINLLQDMSYTVNQQLLTKAESIKTTNERLTTLNTNKKRITLTEPALNIMHMLASVKKIKQGDYSDYYTAHIPKKSKTQSILRRNINVNEPKIDNGKLDPFFYKECIYYLTNYGSHTANIAFYMTNSSIVEVLKYCYDNLVDRDVFTESIYLECLKKDKVNELLRCMSDIDSTFEVWSEYITQTCRWLEMHGRLDALYAFQCGTGQHARAAATCARLYSRPVASPIATTLLSRQHHLITAIHHLGQCVPVTNKSYTQSFHMHLDKITIEKHLTTISRQIELGKYLATCETTKRLTDKMINEVIPGQSEESGKEKRPLTLFGSNTDRVRLAAVVLVASQTVEEGFNLAQKIINDNALDAMKIYCHVTKYLVQNGRFMEVKMLAKCIRNIKNISNSTSDEILETGVTAVVNWCSTRGQLHDEQAETLIEDIQSIAVKISCYLECRILPSAYILAVRNDRSNDLRRILSEATRLGNEQIRNACLKRLNSKNNNRSYNL